MEDIAYEYQKVSKKEKAEAVYKKKAKYTKPILQCGVLIQSRAAYDYPWLPVLVIRVIL
jgi:hypothetical protein